VGLPGAARWLEQVRGICLALPGVTERPSHGEPCFFVGKKAFATLVDDHHGDGLLAVLFAAGPEAQGLLVQAEPRLFYVPAYVGHLGWVGLRLDRRPALTKVRALLEQAWRVRAPARLVKQRDA
jgi:hypothetical protein